jgi:outer membrane lipoprotein-sorting protein
MKIKALVLSVFGLSASSFAEPLERVLGKMDANSVQFRSMTGDIKKTTHTKIINDSSDETGEIFVKKFGPKSLRMLIQIAEPDPKSYSFAERKAEIYFPKMKTVQIYDLGKHSQLLDQFLLLGFGTSGKELTESYNVKATGEETVGGQKATRLELIPKSASVREHLSKAELWVDTGDARIVQQKFYEPSGDYRLVTFSDVKWNAELPDSAVRLSLPKDTKREYPQK